MDPDPNFKAKYFEVLEKYSTMQEKQLALQEEIMRLVKELGEKDRLIAKLENDNKQLHDAPLFSSKPSPLNSHPFGSDESITIIVKEVERFEHVTLTPDEIKAFEAATKSYYSPPTAAEGSGKKVQHYFNRSGQPIAGSVMVKVFQLRDKLITKCLDPNKTKAKQNPHALNIAIQKLEKEYPFLQLCTPSATDKEGEMEEAGEYKARLMLLGHIEELHKPSKWKGKAKGKGKGKVKVEEEKVELEAVMLPAHIAPVLHPSGGEDQSGISIDVIDPILCRPQTVPPAPAEPVSPNVFRSKTASPALPTLSQDIQMDGAGLKHLADLEPFQFDKLLPALPATSSPKKAKKDKKEKKELNWEKLHPAYGKSIDELKVLCKTITDTQAFSMAANGGIKKGQKKNHILGDLHEWLLHNRHRDPEEERKSAAAAEAFPSGSGSKDICFDAEPVQEKSKES
ncbi:hypothetical protein JCM5296_005643 [Sporobolomyces johnsonii]